MRQSSESSSQGPRTSFSIKSSGNKIAHHIELSCNTVKPSLLIMKFLLILALVAFVAATKTAPKPDYSRYENFNVDEVIDNERFLSGYSKCFQGIGSCTGEASDFKTWIPNAMESNCSGCSDHQKTLVARVIKAIMEKLPEDWKKLNKIYNPEGKYTESLKEFVKKYAIKA